MTDRHRPAKDMLRLIQILSAHKAYGLTIDEIAERMETARRTAQRYVSSLQDIEPDLTFRIDEASQKKHWYLPSRRTRVPYVSAEQLASLTEIAAFMEAQGHAGHARFLEDLRASLQASLESAILRRLEPDLEVLDASLEVTHRPGPRATFDPAVRSRLLEAILAEKQVSFQYTDVPGTKVSQRTVSPLALVAGPRSYLVGRDESLEAIRNFALTGINDLAMLDDVAKREDFNAAAYVAKSFGAFHDGKFGQWVLRFKPEAAHELMSYQFHPTQTMSTLPSGEVEVTFQCESIREIAYECFRWSEQIVAIGPGSLRHMIRDICADMEKVCREQ